MKNTKELTINDLAVLMDTRFTGMEKRIFAKIDSSIEELARITNHGFEEVNKRFDKIKTRLDKIEERLDKIEKDIKFIKLDLEDVKIRLDNVAHHFELQEMERKFEKRFKTLEMKVGIKYAT